MSTRRKSPAAEKEPKEDSFSLVPSARLQRFLGRELIADPNLAVIEFVKNAYDAGASRAVLDFRLDDDERSLVVSDDGIGMDAVSFRKNWMRPGFSEKSVDAPAGSPTRGRKSASETRQALRTPLGEKGLGRLASGRLGDVLEVYTRRHRTDEWLHVTFDWRRFEDMNKAMSEIPIPYDWEPPPFEPEFEVGTIILIRGLRLRWEGRVPGRPVVGRSRSRLGRLKQDLQWLLRPLNEGEADFIVEVRSDLFDKTTDLGLVTPSSLERDAAYRLHFDVDLDESGKVTIARTLHRGTEIAEELGELQVEKFPLVRLDEDLAKRLSRPPALSCGPISGFFSYDPPPKGKRAAADSAVGHGVLLYRDRALIEPYGVDGNDWVGVESRKAQRQGHALVQPNTLAGEVHISREKNPDLVDMANRQGLIDNDASGEFMAHVQAEFRAFEALISPELERRHYKSKKEQAAESAEQRLALARVRMRSVAHSLRQPLLGLSGEMLILRQIARRADVPDDVRERIERVSVAASGYVQRAEAMLARLSDLKVPSFEQILPASLIAAAVADADDAVAANHVSLTVEVSSDRELVVPTALVVDALAELVRNAAEASRPEGRIPAVAVRVVDHGSRDVGFEIADNGSGLEGVDPHTPLADVRLETKGRPYGGLVLVSDSITIVRGSVELIENGSDGTRFLVVLPGRLEGGVVTDEEVA